MDIQAAQQMIDLLVRSAPKLRDAGVVELEFEGCRVRLAPPEPPPQPPDSDERRPWSSDPLDDPSTYPGGRVPTYRREEHE